MNGNKEITRVHVMRFVILSKVPTFIEFSKFMEFSFLG